MSLIKQHDDEKEEIDTNLFYSCSESPSRYHPNYSMAQPGPDSAAFLRSLHACQTVEHFCDRVQGYYSRQAQETAILNDDALHISQIAIYKRCSLAQHEAIVITLGPPGYDPHDPNRGFHILVDRTVNFATLARGLSKLCLYQKAALDRIQCIPTAYPPWTRGSASRVWTMMRKVTGTAAPGCDSDRLNILHLVLLLRTISAEAGTGYDALQQNCYWFTWAFRESLRLLTHDRPELGKMEINEIYPRCFFAMGTCFGHLMGRPTHGELEEIYRALIAAYTNFQVEVSRSCI